MNDISLNNNAKSSEYYSLPPEIVKIILSYYRDHKLTNAANIVRISKVFHQQKSVVWKNTFITLAQQQWGVELIVTKDLNHSHNQNNKGALISTPTKELNYEEMTQQIWAIRKTIQEILLSLVLQDKSNIHRPTKIYHKIQRLKSLIGKDEFQQLIKTNNIMAHISTIAQLLLCFIETTFFGSSNRFIEMDKRHKKVKFAPVKDSAEYALNEELNTIIHFLINYPAFDDQNIERPEILIYCNMIYLTKSDISKNEEILFKFFIVYLFYKPKLQALLSLLEEFKLNFDHIFCTTINQTEITIPYFEKLTEILASPNFEESLVSMKKLLKNHFEDQEHNHMDRSLLSGLILKYFLDNDYPTDHKIPTHFFNSIR